MILEEIKEILADHFEITPGSIDGETLLVDDLGAGELDLADIAMDIEDQYSVEVTEEALEGLKTVEDIVLFIEENVD
ncbi:MAG: acyl carrier protein [Eubacterium sp.]|nr:acyl carrier protein [Eubacterium sp.]